MEASDPVTKHRLELLERTVYALQAQHRLLEYRIQHIEDENKALKVKAVQNDTSSTVSTSKPPPQSASSQLASLHYDAFLITQEVRSEASTHALSNQVQRNTSHSILDEPSPISTPALTPSRMQRAVSGLRNNAARALPFVPASAPVSITSPNEITDTSEKDPANGRHLKSVRKVRPADVPWDGTISWKLFNVFRDQEEEKKAMLNDHLKIRPGPHGELQNQSFFQYGLRYLPKDGDKDAYRTVRVEGLPRDVTLDKLLIEVCYGELYSIDLLNTYGITGYHTARLVFLYQQSARAFCTHVRKKGVFVQGTRIRATLERTATYPIGARMRNAIDNDCCTRCLTISNLDSVLVERTRSLISRSSLRYSTEVLTQEDEDTIHIRFHSMKAAATAYQEIADDYRFKGCLVMYSKDPCNRVPSA